MCKGNILVPLRAMTNRDVENLLVGGLAMAQSFMVNSALRMSVFPLPVVEHVFCGLYHPEMTNNLP